MFSKPELPLGMHAGCNPQIPIPLRASGIWTLYSPGCLALSLRSRCCRLFSERLLPPPLTVSIDVSIQANPLTGSLGTSGRRCERSSRARKVVASCVVGVVTTCRGHVLLRGVTHCKFQWCCYVRCKTCERFVTSTPASS